MRSALIFFAVVWALGTSSGAYAQTANASADIGPVLVNGKSTLGISFSGSATQSVAAAQSHAPSGTYFTATPGMLCTGTVKVAGTSQALPGNPITSSGPFTFTRTGSPMGCAVTISSSAGGASATVVFQ
ncbi:MAG TPA: hypothetical protein VMD07_03370 [Candidatus Acidoferrales bacterium]|nr:hypothetical protein [Candidatus Acidoferrales bacterium]